jgi:cytochrome c1
MLAGEMKTRAGGRSIVCMGACLLLAGCNAGHATRSYLVATGGNAQRGKALIRGYGCGACHVIPGIHGAVGLVGPPLFYLGERTMIAGELPNTPANLAHWIEHPKSVNPKTAMPDLGLTEDQAYDIAAYLYTLRAPEGSSWLQ